MSGDRRSGRGSSHGQQGQGGQNKPSRSSTSRSKLFAPLLAAGLVVGALVGVPTSGGAAPIPATYTPLGPSPITGGQVENVSPSNEVAGAVHTVVAHPADPDVLWIGTTNGGVWRTTNATSASPSWVPLTDQMPGLSIGALELDPTVATNTVLVAGVGRFSSFRGTGGPLVGLLRSADGGTSWTPIGGGDLAGENISGVAPRGNTIVVSANGNTRASGLGQGGVFRSINGGADFTRLSGDGTSGLPNVGVFDLVGDPSDSTRLYATAQTGIFRSEDTGATWVNVTNETSGTISSSNTNNIELAVLANGTNVVYAGIVNNGQLAGLFRSTDMGGSWNAMDIPQTNEGGTPIGIQPRAKPGSQGATHFSIRADLTDSNVVYLGGDRQPRGAGPDGTFGTMDDQFPNSIGAMDFSGRLFRCDASLATGSQCAPITHNGTAIPGSAPHADSREMVWDANGDMIEVDDGGVYRQTDPATANGGWESLNGDLQISEHHSCAYDNVAEIILCGNQDTGAPEQTSSGSTTWQTLSAGDGGFIAVEDVAPTWSVRYSSSNNLGSTSFRRRLCNAANACLSVPPMFNVVGQAQTIQAFDSSLPLYTPLVLNEVDTARLVVTSNNVYESTDRLDNLNVILTGLGTLPSGNPVLTTRAIAYGGRAGGVDNPNVLWFGTNDGRLFLRTDAVSAPVQLGAWSFGNPSDIVLDPENWAVAYVSVGTQVFQTVDAGASFNEITGNLGSVAPNANVRSLEAVRIPGTSDLALLAGTDTGVFLGQTQNLGAWAELGSSLPNTVAFDLEHDTVDDVLLVGTLGRGSWLVEDLTDLIPLADLSITKSDSPDPVIAGEELFYTVTVTNNGPDDAFGVVMVDDLPDEVIYLSDDAGCTYDETEHQLTCELDDIAAGASVSITIKTLVRSDAVVAEDDGTLLIENVASVQSASFDTNLANNTAVEPTFVQELADLDVTKICKPDDQLPAGEIGTCTVFVDNLGPSSARDVVVRDTHLSDGSFTIHSVTPSQGSCDPVVNGEVECNLGALEAASPSAAGRATIVVELSATEGVDINDIAVATAATPDPDPSNNEAQDSLSVLAVADLAITKTGPPTVIAGTNATYDLSIVNDGPSTAEGVVIEDIVPPGVDIVSVSGSDGASCNAGAPGDPNQPTTCSFGTLAPGANRTMTIEVFVHPDTLGIIHNDARVESNTFDDDLSDNLDTVATDVQADADLSITKGDTPDAVIAGNDLSYTITVTNNGPSTAEDVLITDTLPAGTSFVDGVDSNGTTVCALVQPDTVVCDLGTLQPGDSETVLLTVTVDPSVPDGSILTNTVTVTSSTPDSNLANNTASSDTTVTTSAELWLDKTGEQLSGNPSPLVSYTLHVHNDEGCEIDSQSSPTPTCGMGGPSDAQNVVVTDTLPLNPQKLTVQFVSPQCTYTEATHSVECMAATVPAGASVSFVIEAQIQGSVGLITNTATLVSDTSDPVSDNNTDSVDILHRGNSGKN